MQQGFNAERPLGYAQVPATAVDAGGSLATLLAAQTATGGLTAIPTGTSVILIRPEGQAVRWRDDAILPTAAVGMPLAVAETLRYTAGREASLGFISSTAGAILNLAFYAH
jgi:hypothetical protein